MGRKLIDKEQAYKTLSKYYHHTGMIQHQALREALDRVPVVDAVPVRHGKWIPVDSYSAFGGDEEAWIAHGNPVAFHYCSECRNHAYINEFGEEILSNYCPDCGSRNGADE